MKRERQQKHNRKAKFENLPGTPKAGIDTQTDASLENFDPDTTAGRVPQQDEDLERGSGKRRIRKGASTTDRK